MRIPTGETPVLRGMVEASKSSKQVTPTMGARASISSQAADSFTCDLHGFQVEVSACGGRVARAARRFLRLFLGARPEAGPRLAISASELGPAENPGEAPGRAAHLVLQRQSSPEVAFSILEEHGRVFAVFNPGGTVVVRPEEGVASCFVEGEALTRWPGLPAVMLERALLELLARHSWFGLHSGGVEENGCAALLCGGGSVGKTTACLTLLASGFRCIGDDKLLLEMEGSRARAWVLAGDVGVCVNSLPRLPQQIRRSVERWGGSGAKVWLPVERIVPDGQAMSATPAAVLFPEIAEQREPELRPMSIAQAMTRLTEQGLATCSPGAEGRFLELASSLLAQAPPFRLVLGSDLHRLPDLVREAMTSSA